MKWTGGCLCGAVRYEVRGKPTFVGHCHCDRCRRFLGAAFATGATFPADAVAWTKEKPTLYPSSPGVDRGFCPTCGSSLTFQRPGRVFLLIGSLDRPEDIDMREPREFEASHTFFSEKIPWVHVEDDLPRFDRFPT
jgi:adenylate cyclase